MTLVALKNRILNNSKLSNVFQGIKLFYKTILTPYRGDEKKYPRVVQLPITYNCNSKCVMCNIWKMDYSNELSLDEFKQMLKDPILKKVRVVGINGGEPSLVKNIDEYVHEIVKLPKLNLISIISHGFNKKLLLPQLEKIYAICKQNGVGFHVSISMDGYGKTHETVRGLKVFKLTDASVKEIRDNLSTYCDSYDVACTIMRQNINQLIEMEAYANLNNYPIKFRMGIENKRIESDKLKNQYTAFIDGPIQTAKEFFWGQYKQAANLWDMFRCYAIHYHLISKNKKRLLGCYWQTEGVTLDSRGDMYYCAVESEKIGSLRAGDGTGEQQFFSDENLAYRQTILKNNCDNCIHDYYGKPTLSSLMIFVKELWFEKTWWVKYYLKSKFI